MSPNPAERVQAAVSSPINLGGREVFTTLSIGVAVTTGGYQDAEDLLRVGASLLHTSCTCSVARSSDMPPSDAQKNTVSTGAPSV